MTRDNTGDAAEQRHADGREISTGKELREAVSDFAIEVDVEQAFDIARLVSCLNAQAASGRFHSLGALHRLGLRHERVRENVKRFVEIRAGVIRRHTGAETDAILWHRGIVDRRDP